MYYLLFTIQMIGLFLFSPALMAETEVQLYYAERIPYAVTDEHGDVQGLTATPAAKDFKQAGIQFQWKKCHSNVS